MQKKDNNITCNKCKKLNLVNLRYQKQINNTLHLLGNCPDCGTRFVPFASGLDIPTVPSKRSQKNQTTKINQSSLF